MLCQNASLLSVLHIRANTSRRTRWRSAPRSTDMSSAEEMPRRRSPGQHARWLSTGWLMCEHPNTTSVWSLRRRSSFSVLHSTANNHDDKAVHLICGGVLQLLGPAQLRPHTLLFSSPVVCAPNSRLLSNKSRKSRTPLQFPHTRGLCIDALRMCLPIMTPHCRTNAKGGQSEGRTHSRVNYSSPGHPATKGGMIQEPNFDHPAIISAFKDATAARIHLAKIPFLKLQLLLACVVCLMPQQWHTSPATIAGAPGGGSHPRRRLCPGFALQRRVDAANSQTRAGTAHVRQHALKMYCRVLNMLSELAQTLFYQQMHCGM